jgi:hypothetical protein
LDSYEDVWPVSDIVKMHLKNTSSNYKQAKEKKAAAAARNSNARSGGRRTSEVRSSL